MSDFKPVKCSICGCGIDPKIDDYLRTNKTYICWPCVEGV